VAITEPEPQQNESTSSTEDFTIVAPLLEKPEDDPFHVTLVGELIAPFNNQDEYPSDQFIHFLRQVSNEDADTMFRNAPLRKLAGVRFDRSRVASLGEVLKSKRIHPNSVELCIHTGTSPYETLMREARLSVRVMTQTFVFDLGRIIKSNSLSSDATISAPIASVYRDYLLGPKFDTQLGFEGFSNAKGNALLATKLIASPKWIDQLEYNYSLRVWEDATLFDASVATDVYQLPTTDLVTSSFSIVQQIDLDGLSTEDWLQHKTLLGKYIALMYESTYLAAIKGRANRLLLSPVLANATQAQLSYMLKVLVRVHTRLSPFLGDCHFVLTLPEFSRDSPEFRRNSDFFEAVNSLASEGATLVNSVSGSDVMTLITPTVEVDRTNHPSRKSDPIVEIEIDIHGDEVEVLVAREESYHLSLDRYVEDSNVHEMLKAVENDTITLMDNSVVRTNRLVVKRMVIGGRRLQ
jgi:hypothetical protein